jgi:hypothetical protein
MKSRPEAAFQQGLIAALGQNSRLALPPICHVADAHKAEDHHRPGGGLGNGCDYRIRYVPGNVKGEVASAKNYIIDRKIKRATRVSYVLRGAREIEGKRSTSTVIDGALHNRIESAKSGTRLGKNNLQKEISVCRINIV